MQLDMNLERLQSAIDLLLIRLAQTFTTTKLQHLFLLNNYDMAISVLKVCFLLQFIISHLILIIILLKVYCSFSFLRKLVMKPKNCKDILKRS